MLRTIVLLALLLTASFAVCCVSEMKKIKSYKTEMDMPEYRGCMNDVNPAVQRKIDNAVAAHQGLTKKQACAVFAYTGSDYGIVNCYYRTKGLPKSKTVFPKWLEQFTKLLTQGLSKFPVHQGKVYRYAHPVSLKKGDRLKNLSYLSTSVSDHQINEKKTGNHKNLLLTIEVEHENEITAVSKFANEKEILIKPYECFKVVSVGAKVRGKNWTEASLERDECDGTEKTNAL
ncbi:NAD(P)(+)-arginine ADP-ribosyltransferase [Acrasis kona]|uniref:NAD(P)(+)--arginine ADP-ribosyltransferase n=1 Tax=Acrasis kona TaxID=1008807 RepID=A0AAW2ZF38_9EUKA